MFLNINILSKLGKKAMAWAPERRPHHRRGEVEAEGRVLGNVLQYVGAGIVD